MSIHLPTLPFPRKGLNPEFSPASPMVSPSIPHVFFDLLYTSITVSICLDVYKTVLVHTGMAPPVKKHMHTYISS
jgi:hypothetical protein